MDLEELAARHREAAAKLGPPDVRNVQPSIRDFARYVTTERAELCVVAEWRGQGGVAEFARAAEMSGAYVVALGPEASAAHIREASRATQLPILARGIVLDENDLYRLRDAGADAATVHAKLHAPDRLTALWKAARSMRMEIVVEATDEPSLAAALASEAKVVGVSSAAVAHVRSIPRGIVPVLCEARSPEDVAPLVAHLDAVIVPSADVAAFTGLV